MTVAELIEELKKLPQDYIVCVPENGDVNYYSKYPSTALGYFHPHGRFYDDPETIEEGDEPWEEYVPTLEDVRAVVLR